MGYGGLRRSCGSDFDAGRCLAAFVLGAEQLALDLRDEGFVSAVMVAVSATDFSAQPSFEDAVQQGVGGKAILVLLVGAKLGGGGLSITRWGITGPSGPRPPS